MAEDQDQSEKTEEPTQKKLDDARQKGDVPKSAEIAGFAVLAAGAAMFAAFSGPLSSTVARELSGFFAHAHDIPTGAAGARIAIGESIRVMALALAAPLGALVVFAIAAHLGQTGLIFSAEKMKPKLDKLSPISGLKRLFGAQGAANFLKGLAKLIIVGVAVFLALWPRRDQLERLSAMDIGALLPLVRDVIIALLIAALTVYAMLAAADFIGQRFSWMKRQRMSRYDIKQEAKQSEGDPHVRARLRQIRAEKSKRRMIAAVPDATVVIANPTHFAVALKYEKGETAAPVCVAKGVDVVALKIREVAEKNRVPVVEDPPLARALFATVEVDREIPRDHYEAVAKIIGYVLSIAQGGRAR